MQPEALLKNSPTQFNQADSYGQQMTADKGIGGLDVKLNE